MNFNKDIFKNYLTENVKTLSKRMLHDASEEQIYEALVFTIRDYITDKWIATHNTYTEEDPKVLYYLSMEFLMGRFFGNSILNMNMYQEVKEVLEELNINYNFLEETERDPGLGNGGLGRLAACFLDSLATLKLPAYGCGIRYHYGIFEQKIENGYQKEYPDNWLENGDMWGVKRQEYAQEIKFGGTVRAVKVKDDKYRFIQENYQSIIAIPYDYPVVGYKSNNINTLRLWDAEAKNKFDLQSFNQGDYSKAVEDRNLAKILSEVLYPADQHLAGKELRIRQQYFFISATIQKVIQGFKEKHVDFSILPDKVAFQLNDTHPSMAVAELMRVLIDENDLDWEEAWDITKKTCAYTNHTIMSEALEKWPVEIFARLLPRIYMIIEEINKRFCAKLIEKYGENPSKIRNMAIVADGQIKMAHLAIVGSHSVNGVAQLHTEILKNQELKDFYELYPERFNNKTNGVTQRRWLAHANPELTELIKEKIGEGFLTELIELKKLEAFVEDKDFIDRYMEVKHNNKVKLAKYIKRTMGIDINPNSIFDIQIKRLHEYKRQLLNILHILSLYNDIKVNPGFDMVPRTFIFAAKSAASYSRAKLIIKLINSVSELINNDETIEGKIKVIFAPNYCVSLAEKLIPAADVSEQISTASKEASGTGNMKFMINGAITIGTLDGANVEINEEVGDENCFIFGLKAEEVIDFYQRRNYNPWDIYNMNHDLRTVLGQLINGTLDKDTNLFREIYDALLNGYNGAMADEYFVLKDFESYKKTQQDIDKAYRDKSNWAKMAILNTANSGKFSSDRTIKEYSDEIWNLKPIEVKIED